MEANKILEFLDSYATKSRADDPIDYVELMMDDHKYIEFENIGYYIPEHSMLWESEQEEVYNYLIENQQV